jgi:hypothetical protein
MKLYYTHDGDRILGPYAIHELRNLLITTSTPIWYEGLPDWTTAGNVPALIPYLTLGTDGPPPIKKQTEEPLPPDQQPGYVTTTKTNYTVFWVVLIGLFVLLAVGVLWYVKQDGNETSLNILPGKTQEELDKEFIASQEMEEKRIREQLVFKKKQKHRKNWKRYIKASAKYDAMSFLGGLENVKVTIKNSSEYMLDRVQVRVQYIKKDGEVWDTEVLSVSGIDGKATKVVDAPESLRGKSVDVTIINVKSEEMNFCYPNGGNGTKDDPYYCK